MAFTSFKIKRPSSCSFYFAITSNKVYMIPQNIKNYINWYILKNNFIVIIILYLLRRLLV